MLQMLNRVIYGLLLTLFLLFTVPGCRKNNETQASALLSFTSFRDIPGVTADETKAIEALQKEYNSFIYGMNPTTEAFYGGVNNDEIKGYSALFCEWLSGLFDIPFKPAIFKWGDLISGLESGEINFTGDLMATEDRKKIYHMTGAIVERSLRAFRIAGGASLSLIMQSRPPRFIFLENSAVFDPVMEIAEYPFEYIFVNDFFNAYDLLKSGEYDALLVMGISEAAFDIYNDVTSEIFIPLVYNSASLSTQNPKLAPVISIVQKALQHSGTRRYLSGLYKTGYNDYQKHSLLMQLTADEIKYIQNNPVVRFAAEVDNYPISFFNNHEGMWQGVAIEVLKVIENITGLTFEIANSTNVNWPILLGMLERGEVSMITELVRTTERIGHFLWPGTAFMEDQAILLSKLDYPDIDINEIINIKTGVVRNSVYAELFKRWFPNHTHLLEYNSIGDVLYALDRGEIELVMGRTNQYLNIINYRELFGYKINAVFNSYFETVFGFNKDEDVLCSIVDKSLKLIDTANISMDWSHKAYDYRYKVIEAQRPWLFGATVLSLCIVALILVLFQRNRHYGKLLEDQVRNRTAEIKAVIDNYKGVIWSVDHNKIITTIGGQYLNKIKIQSSFLIGKNLERARLIDKRLDIIDHVNKTFDEGTQDWISDIDGSMFHSITTPIFDSKNNMTSIVGSTDDVTELIILQRKLEAAVNDAQTANKAKSHFVTNMSHEMRTPMNVIVGLTELMLEDDDIPPVAKESLEKINIAGKTLMGIINDILDISKIEAGKFALRSARYDVAKMLNDIIVLNIVRIGEKPITFHMKIDENIPCVLLGDELRVKQIANNLLSNAFKYTQKGSVILGVNFEREGESEAWLSLYVSDTGIGIRGEDIEKLFADYNQVDPEANRKVEGTGLGLSITKRLVESMDGEITVESEYGKGTTFRLRIRQGFVIDIPLSQATLQNLAGFKYLEKQKQSNEKFVRPDLSYARVLVVDDMQTNLDVVKSMLAKYKIWVDCVMNGHDAVKYIDAGTPEYNVIFMDHMMPDMDGIETAGKIRALGTEYAKKIPIIALTANAAVGNEQMFLEHDFQAFLPKPVNIIDLDTIVRKWIQY